MESTIETLGVAFFSSMSILIPAYWIHLRESRKHKEAILKKEEEIADTKRERDDHKIKADVLDKVLDFASFNAIKEGVDELFEQTRADRFLILIAINGCEDFNMISVIFEQHKDSQYKVSAIARYKSLSIDTDYRNMLKLSEKYGKIELETEKMPPCLLKDIYQIESVTHSDVRHLVRVKIDDKNDVLVYSSLATHHKMGFTKMGRRRAEIIYDSVIRVTIKNVLG